MGWASSCRCLLAIAAMFACSPFAVGEESETKTVRRSAKKHYYNSYVGKRPPELTAADEHWVNQKTKVTLEKLQGQVVWLEFNF